MPAKDFAANTVKIMDIASQMYKVACSAKMELNDRRLVNKEQGKSHIPLDFNEKSHFYEKLRQVTAGFNVFSFVSDKPDHTMQVQERRHFDDHVEDPPTSDATLDLSYSHEIRHQDISINDELKSVPLTHHQLSRCIRKRLEKKSTSTDHRLIMEMFMDEVKIVWRVMKMQKYDHYLTLDQNREILRRMFVYIASMIVETFDMFVSKMKIYHDRRVFTDFANVCRLRSEISVFCHKILNVDSIRRLIISTMDKSASENFTLLDDKGKHKTESIQKDLISPQEYNELLSAMPSLDKVKIRNIFINFAPVSTDIHNSIGDADNIDFLSFFRSKERKSTGKELEEERAPVLITKYPSMPDLMKTNMVEEFDVHNQPRECNSASGFIDSLANQVQDSTVPVEQRVRDDLALLMKKEQINKCDFNTASDMSPLIRATIQCNRFGDKYKFQKLLKQMMDKDAKKTVPCIAPSKSKPKHMQPSTVDVNFSTQMTFRASDARISYRECLSTLCLSGSGPVFNELTGEISTDALKKLDEPIRKKQEIYQVFEEMMKSINPFHMQLDHHDFVEKCPPNFFLDQKSPKTLAVERARIINNSIEVQTSAPWGKKAIMDWCKTSSSGESSSGPNAISFIPDIENLRLKYQPVSSTTTLDIIPSVLKEREKKTFEMWFNWWRDVISYTDYSKYLCTKRTDYLGVIGHFYDDEPEIAATPELTEEEAEFQAHVSEIRKMEKEQYEDLKQQQSHFEKGLWNTASVLFGGLGEEPIDKLREIGSFFVPPYVEVQTASTRPSLQEIGSSLMPPSVEGQTSRTRPSLPEIDSPMMPSYIEVPTASTQPSQESQLISATSSDEKVSFFCYESLADQLDKDRKDLPRMQKYLDVIWSRLQVPEDQRLNMALKYSCREMYPFLKNAISQWDDVSRLIEIREEIMDRLEKFERIYSDPDRFFQKKESYTKDSIFYESNQRKSLHKELKKASDKINLFLKYIEKHYQDVVTYKGRPYKDKMKWDTTEMLFWLQEERKEHSLRYCIISNNLTVKKAQTKSIFIFLAKCYSG